MRAVNPYLNFHGNTEEAFTFYRSVFGGEFLGVARFRDLGGEAMGLAEADLDRIAHIALPLGPDNVLMATDHVDSLPGRFEPGNNFHISLETESAEEAERLFEALSDGGRVEMPLGRTEWAEKYGSLVDRFGVGWMVSFTGDIRFEGHP